MPKFIIHWDIKIDLDNGVTATQHGKSIVDAVDQADAEVQAYADLMEVLESNSSSGAVPLTKETAEEYGVEFEEGEQ